MSDPIKDIGASLRSVINLQNPYDSVGIWHNLSLYHAANELDLHNTNDSMVKAAILSYYDLSASTYDFALNVNLPFHNYSYNQLAEISVDSFVDINNSILSSDEVQLFGLVRNIIESTSQAGLQTFVDSVISFESFVLDSTFQLERTKPAFLGMTSILRHSADFWNSALTDEAHPYFDILNEFSSSEASTRFFEWIIYVLVDALAYMDCYAHACMSCLTDDLMKQICPGQAAYSSYRRMFGY